ncbi:MAG: response regulator [Phycisphaerae bacterium]|nr:response regulator [Gemmatimonadaceae bacterium]
MRKDAQDILDTVQRAHTLTTQLLTFSRRQVVRPRQVDLNELVRGTESMLRRVIGADIKLALSLAEGPVRVLADAGQLEQVLMNLVVNARDAIALSGLISIGTGRAVVDAAIASIRPELDPGDYAVLTVTDSGAGMDNATAERIFEPFFTTKEAGKGTGLGLATVFGIVKQAGGHIFVYSELGLGTTFRIYLPHNDTSVGAQDRTRVGAPPALGGSETILLVEDEPHVRLLARRILTESGYTVIEAESGSEALVAATLHSGAIHLLISDVVLPGMNGPDVAERLHQSRPDMKVLFMSGYTPDASLHHRITQAGTPFLEKPFSRSGLATVVRATLD